MGSQPFHSFPVAMYTKDQLAQQGVLLTQPEIELILGGCQDYYSDTQVQVLLQVQELAIQRQISVAEAIEVIQEAPKFEEVDTPFNPTEASNHSTLALLQRHLKGPVSEVNDLMKKQEDAVGDLVDRLSTEWALRMHHLLSQTPSLALQKLTLLQEQYPVSGNEVSNLGGALWEGTFRTSLPAIRTFSNIPQLPSRTSPKIEAIKKTDQAAA